MNDNSRLFDFLYHQQRHFPRKVLLSSKNDGHWHTYSTAEVIDIVNRFSAGLLQLGLSGNDMTVEKQDKVAVISRNCPEWVMLDLACQQIGVLLVPVYPTTGLKELEFIFNDAAVKYVFVNGSDLSDKLNGLKNKIPSLRDIYSFDRHDNVPHWTTIFDSVNDSFHPEVERIKEGIMPEHCATIIYTSGTTGTPKGVMLSHRNIVMNVLNAVKTFPFPVIEDGRALSFLPLNHIFERVATYIYFCTGISIYYAESMDTIGENLKEVKPMLFTTVPRLLEKVYDRIMRKGAELKGIKSQLFYWAVALAEKYDVENQGSVSYRLQLWLANRIIFSKWREALGNRVQFIVTGGAACQVKLLRIFTAAGVPVYEGYGPTENSPVISVNCRKKGGTRFGSVGLVIEGQQVKIEEDGEICVKGPSVMMGYYKRPDLTAEVVIDGWLHTGDIGTFEEGRYLKITDRKKELFKTSGGKYVAPQSIENKLKTRSTLISQVIVHGDKRNYCSVLLTVVAEEAEKFLGQKGVSFPADMDANAKYEAMTQKKELQEEIWRVIEELNKDLASYESLKKFALLPRDLTVEEGDLTPSLKVKRKAVEKKYLHILDGFYKDSLAG